jgi:ribosomal protein S18 acetylase RimI-like enzyme
METKAFTVEVMNLAVKEEFQNKGIGKQLLLYVIDEIKKGNTKTIEIGTGNPGVVQMLLYQKCGFRIVDIDFDFFRRTHPERIYENGIECRDMIRMRISL